MIKMDGKKLTPKQWAKEVIHNDLELVTDWYYERYHGDWNDMTSKEKDKINEQFRQYHNRILKMIGVVKGRKVDES